MLGKKGQGLSTNAIILIILGVVVLVVLIIGFTLGWDKIAPWLKSDNNVDDIVNACQLACARNNVYDYCTKVMEMKVDGKEFSGSCNVFATLSDYKAYGIPDCSEICPNPSP